MSTIEDPAGTNDAAPSDAADVASTAVDLAASVDDVWEALTTDDGLADWMGEGSTIDLRPDGDLAVNDVVGGEIRHGRVGSIESGERLDVVWWPATRPDEWSTVSFVLEPIKIGTRLTVTETTASNSAAHARSMFCSTADWSWRFAVLTIRCAVPARLGASTIG